MGALFFPGWLCYSTPIRLVGGGFFPPSVLVVGAAFSSSSLFFYIGIYLHMKMFYTYKVNDKEENTQYDNCILNYYHFVLFF